MADPKMEAMEKALDAFADAMHDARLSRYAARAAVLTLYREAAKGATGAFTRADVEQMREDSTFIRKFVGVDAAHLEQGEFEAIWQAGNRLDAWANRIEDAMATDAPITTEKAND